jgi:hypothetical protein
MLITVSNNAQVCRICLELDGVPTNSVTLSKCANDRTGQQFDAYVCERCLEAGRETRVTCRTFVNTGNATADGK